MVVIIGDKNPAAVLETATGRTIQPAFAESTDRVPVGRIIYYVITPFAGYVQPAVVALVAAHAVLEAPETPTPIAPFGNIASRARKLLHSGITYGVQGMAGFATVHNVNVTRLVYGYTVGAKETAPFTEETPGASIIFNFLVVVIRYVNVVIARVDGDIPGLVELVIARSLRTPLAHIRTVIREVLDPMVVAIDDVNESTQLRHVNTPWMVELAGARAGRPPFVKVISRRREYLDAVIPIRYEYLVLIGNAVVRPYGDVVRPVEFPWA
jgi:hypothetical protein